MDGVAISIIGRPRPLPGHDTPNAAHNTYTLKCEELPNALVGAWTHHDENVLIFAYCSMGPQPMLSYEELGELSSLSRRSSSKSLMKRSPSSLLLSMTKVGLPIGRPRK